jgi:hypothetical protein
MPTASESPKVADHPAGPAPIIVDLGKKRRKQIKELRQGRGVLMEEINQVIEELRTTGSLSASAQPIVVVVRPKRKAPNLMWPLG